MLVFFISTIFLYCLHPQSVGCWEDTVFGLTVRFEEVSGRITVSNSNNTFSIMFSELAEMDRNGLLQVGARSDLEHNFKLFRFQRFFSDGPEMYVDVPLVRDQPTDELQNITVYKKNFTTKLNNAATFNIELMIFGNTSTIQSNPAEQYAVSNSTVKFAFSIHDWLFCGYNDTKCYNKDRFEEWGEYLDVYVRYAGGRRVGEPPEFLGRRRARKVVDWSDYHPTTYDYGGAEVTSSRVYRLTIPTMYEEWNPFIDPTRRKWYWYTNHTWDALPRGYPLHMSKKDHSYVTQQYEVFRFPTFFQPLYYEAFVDLHTMSYYSKSDKSKASVCATLAMSLLTFLCVLYIQ